MANAPSYKAVLKHFREGPNSVKVFFPQLPRLLVNRYPLEVALAYLFLRTENAHNRTLYCGAVKLHRAESRITERVVNKQHLTRDGFLELFENVLGKPLPDRVTKRIKAAEKVRDRVVHGKEVSDAELREALVDVLDYAKALNAAVKRIAGFRPLGDLRGFKGRAGSLDNTTSRWLLKGLGFAVA